MRSVGLIGFGAIGAAIVEMWPRHLLQHYDLAAILVRPDRVESTSAQLGPQTVVTPDLDIFLNRRLDIIIEAASHSAVCEYGASVLRTGCELHLLSVGALADQAVLDQLKEAALRGGGRVVIPPGALAGFDGLLSLRAAGLISVKYTSTKPSAAWRDTVAEASFCLDELQEPTVVYSGTARTASTRFPRNANLATAVALAGIGLDKTVVELVADPAATENSGRIEALSAAGRLDVALTGAPFSDNPKTSRITAMSVVAALLDQNGLIRFS